MATVITIAGKAEAGKDTVAKMIKVALTEKGKKVCIIHFADYLKFACEKYLGWDGIKDSAGRTLLQYEGTDYVRQRDFDFWIKIVDLFICMYKERFDYFIIPDARFPNECDWFKYHKDINSVTVRVVRLEYENSLTEDQKKHYSETALDNYAFNSEIRSRSGMQFLEKVVLAWVETFSLTLGGDLYEKNTCNI
jgi:hypothetical protein